MAINLTPRKSEVEAVVALLESGEYISPQDMAKDIVRAVYGELLQRETFALLFRFTDDGPIVAWGPFTSDKEAERFAERVGAEGQYAGMRMHPPAVMAGDVTEATEALCKCGHPVYVHQHKGYAGKCAIKRCTCAIMERQA